jgi:tRNA nucleotidyltransferase/poly(A) polymerase
MYNIWTPAPLKLAKIFAHAHAEVRAVGGCVRDALMGHKPKDIDLCTPLPPLEMLQLGARRGLQTIPTLFEVERKPSEWERGGLKHGTVPFIIDGEVVEVTTLRTDLLTDGRHAEVAFITDWREDAARRDFTFNAMSVDLNGVLYDYFGGYHDLEQGIVRFVGSTEKRIQEDYLRILRYYRFSAKMREKISIGQPSIEFTGIKSQNSYDISQNVKGLESISGERIWLEISKILSIPGKGGGAEQLDAMRETNVLSHLRLPTHPHAHAQAKIAILEGSDPRIALGFLLGDKMPGETLQQYWKLSYHDTMVTEFARQRAAWQSKPFTTFLQDALSLKGRPDLLAAILTGFGRHSEASYLLQPLPQFPINGSDLLELGMQSGPEMGKALRQLHETWRTQILNGENPPTRNDILESIHGYVKLPLKIK